MEDKRLFPYLNEIKKYKMSIPTISDDDFNKPNELIQKISIAVREFTKEHDIKTRIDLKYLHSICYQINDCLMSDRVMPVDIDDIRVVIERDYGKMPNPKGV